jgi:hypothetical protein
VTDQPELALFDLLPATVPEPRRSPRTAAGRARETYLRRVVAEVTIVQSEVLRDEALRSLDTGRVIVLGSADGTPADDDPREEISESSAVALDWLLDPTAGLAGLLEAEAFRLVDLHMSVAETSPVECSVQWTVTVKLQDVGELRAAALAALPAGDAPAAVEVQNSLAAAWNHAVDPYAPLRRIPGITWTGREVTVEQVLTRAGRSG